MNRLLVLVSLSLASAIMPLDRAESHDIPVNTGAGLLANCDYQSDDQEEIEYHFGLCIGFIKGAGNAWAINNEVKWCIKGQFGNKHLHEAVLSRLKILPRAMLDTSAAPLVIAAMEAAYPCR